jgi:hypothetical protein
LIRRLHRAGTTATWSAGAVLLCLLVAGCASFDPSVLEGVLGGASSSAPLDEPTVARGLKEALRVGTERAVATVSQPNGYWSDELIRIRLPEDVQVMANVLGQIGYTQQFDELELAMNRAAERAAGEAVDVFSGALFDMTIADAWGILRGGDTAATEYFRDRTWDPLRQRFQPVIEDRMRQLAVYRKYEKLADLYGNLPFVSRPAVDVAGYVTDSALDGLFVKLAEEEAKIRRDPIARTTELLRRVFAAQR